jgi:predicted dinucleotide-binding enzyme
MNIGIVGAGDLGTGLAKQLVKFGHEVMLSFSRDLAKLRNVASSLGTKVGAPAEAAAFGEVIVLATTWSSTAEALRQIGIVQGGKLLWDCTNALKPDMSGLAIGTTTSGGEQVALGAPWAKVVKAIPPFAEVLHSSRPLVGGVLPGVFVCGDDAEARKTIARLVEHIGGAPVDAGPLSLARYAEPAAMLLVQLAYVQGFGPRIGFAVTRDPVQTAPRAARSSTFLQQRTNGMDSAVERSAQSSEIQGD